MGRNSLVALCIGFVVARACVAQTAFRPPAVPLVTSDPYLSIWSEADHLTDDVTRHWTRREHPLVSLVRIDGKPYRLLGNEPKDVPPMPQTSVQVTPTQSKYQFVEKDVHIDLTFMTPLLPDDLDVLSRPITYITWSAHADDVKKHKVEIYFSAGPQIVVNQGSEATNSERANAGSLTVLRNSAVNQTLLRPMGDDTRINWGSLYLAAPSKQAKFHQLWAATLEREFVETGTLNEDVWVKFLASVFRPDVTEPGLGLNGLLPIRSMEDERGSVGLAFNPVIIGSRPIQRTAMIAYDEIYSIDYYGQKLRPYWRRNGMTMEKLLQKAESDYPSLKKRCDEFDKELMHDASIVGGAHYAKIVALAYRECLAANGLAADANGQPLLFTKENTSNGDIATVDVIFPQDPIFILLSPSLAKASLVSIFDYAASSHWKFPNAPHDLGTYPRVFGRDDGGEGMPVEESANMIILTDAIAQAEGNPDFATRYWPQLTQWANYLEKYGLDPEDQLCTDDFMGHLAHNANLSIKAILALAAYGDLCMRRGDMGGRFLYQRMAKQDAEHWVKVADASDHSLLAFDQPNTWSQKYNLVWDKILNLNIFPPDIARKEVAFYKTKLLPYGFPLDSRTHLTKADWSIWCAAMARSTVDFCDLIEPTYRYLNETTTRDPIADSYETDKVESGGMHARPVVGGFFIRMLTDDSIWKKWARRDTAKVGDWAPLPKPLIVTEVIPTGRTGNALWRYTTAKPFEGWARPGFDDSQWVAGEAPFGTEGTPGIKVKTKWATGDIWMRREISVPPGGNLKVLAYHDEDIEVYVNGVLAASESSYVTDYALLEILPEAQAQLRPGAKVIIAVHCHQTDGGQGVDVGFANVTAG